MYITTLVLKFSAKAFWERVLDVQTSLRQEKRVIFFPSSCMNITISQVLWYLFLTIILEGINTKFHNLQHQKAFTSSWVPSREACVESLLVLEDQPSQTVCHKLEASHLGSSKLVDRNDRKTYRAFYKLRSIVSVTYLLDCRTCNLITCLFDCCKILSMMHDLLVV